MLSTYELKQRQQSTKRAQYNCNKITINLNPSSRQHTRQEKSRFVEKTYNKHARTGRHTDVGCNTIGVSYMLQNGLKQINNKQNVSIQDGRFIFHDKTKNNNFIELLGEEQIVADMKYSDNNNNNKHKNQKQTCTAGPPFFMNDLHERGKIKTIYKPWQQNKRKDYAGVRKTKLPSTPLKIWSYKKEEEGVSLEQNNYWKADEDIKNLAEEATLRQSIQKCQIWLKKYF